MAYKYNFATGKLDFYLPTELPIVPDVQVFFSTTLPTDAGVIFTPNTPSLENVLYISEISGQVYIYNGTTYVSYTSVTPNNTAWYLAGTTIDAGGSKSAAISRNNAIYTIGYDSFFNSVRVGRGNNNISTNTVVGSGAGNTISTGDNNTFNGSQSGRFNSIGKNNSFYGVNSGFYNSGGSDNISIGNSSGMHIANGTTSLTTADKSVFLGADTKALANNQTNQIVIGYNAIGKGSNTVNIGDSFITNTYLQGITSSNSFTSVNDSYFNGVKIGKGTNNIATNTVVGAGSGDTISTGSGNSFFGANSGRVNSIGNFNSFFGTYAGYSNTFADSNTFIGNSAGYNFTTGGGNVSVGYLAGKFYGNLNLPLTTGSNSVYIGNQATALVNGSSNEIVIGSQAMGKGANTVNIGNTSITNTYLNGAVTFNNAFTFPTTDGTANQVLKTNGSGVVTWGTAGSSSGIWGIANASGVYTYYATWALAVAAATSGQVIELFADITESTNNYILKNGVNINGNGHSVTFTGALSGFIDNSVTINCEINNIVINQIGTGQCIKTNASATIIGGNATINSIGTGTVGVYVFSATRVWGFTINGLSPLNGVFSNVVGDNLTINCTGGSAVYLLLELNNCVIKSSTTGFVIASVGTINNCYLYSSGGQIASNCGDINNSTLISAASYLVSSVTNINNCYLKSSGSYLFGNTTNVSNSVGISTTSSIAHPSASIIFDNCKFTTKLAEVVNFGPHTFNNCTLSCEWNNASGYIGNRVAANTKFISCTFKVVNASAYIMWTNTPTNIGLVGCKYQGTTLFLHPNYTNSQIATADAQGNQLIN